MYFNNVLKDLNVTYIDLFSVFMRNVAYRDLDYIYLDIHQGGGHYNVKGGDYIARSLKEVIRQLENQKMNATVKVNQTKKAPART